jgi:hypothetical protein
MLALSQDPFVANQQLAGAIFYLTAFGHLDGHFDSAERQYIHAFVARLVEAWIASSVADLEPPERGALVKTYQKHFVRLCEAAEREIGDLFDEPLGEGEERLAFVHTNLKLRCFEIFRSFERPSQHTLLRTIDELLAADGVAHPEEVRFRTELQRILDASAPARPIEDRHAPAVVVRERSYASLGRNPEFFGGLESHYAADGELRRQQLETDMQLGLAVRKVLVGLRQAGQGQLAGIQNVRAFAGRQPFLDGFTHVFPPRSDRDYEITVLGDLHGCYACLKAALVQSRFFERMAAFAQEPDRHPHPLLVLLGDYIDRGRFSFNGVLRAALKLLLAHPEHVFVLRGNHEFYFEKDGHVLSAVMPSDALFQMKPYAPESFFKHQMDLFHALPQMLLFGPICFVHGGVPRDATLGETYQDLSSLNDPLMRYEMMWSDPSVADVVPPLLQAQGGSRFAFGRLQCQRFLTRLGCHTLVRGHTKIAEGFRVDYAGDGILGVTVFSAGGADNNDLAEESLYRQVRPMALTIRYQAGAAELEPWPIDYQTYNRPELNGFLATDPELTES